MDNEDEDIRCQVMWQLNQDKKHEEVVEHLLTGCIQCITNPKKRFNGKEMLFPNGPPPWIKVPESEKSNPEAWKKYQKQRVHVQMTPEEFDDFLVNSDLSDYMMCFEIAKHKRCEKIQAWKEVREVRRKQKAIRLEAEKKEKELKKKELEAKREAEKLKKADEKRKNTDKKQQRDEEKQEFLDKIEEEKKLLEEVLEDDVAEEGEEEEEEEKKVYMQNEKKEFNLKHQMPWKPLAYDILCINERSQVDHTQQRRIIGMCQNMLYQGQWRHPGNKHELKDIRKACEAEYDTLVAAALEHARKEAVHPLDLTSPGTVKTVLTAFRRREPPPSHYLFKTPIFTVENIETTAGIRSENQAIIPKMERILKKAGWMDELTIPDITKKCALNVNRGLMMMKPSILLDPLAQSLISTCAGVSVMMDATTVCHLLAPNWEARDYEFGMPIEVKTERIDGSEKKIVIVSKPMPSNTITRASIQRKTLKKTLKKQFVTKKAPAKAAPSADQPSTSSSENPKPSEESDSQESQESEAPSSDFLDDIISKMEKPKRKPKKEQLGDSMYQYAIFRIGDARLLVRSNAPYQFIQPGEKKYTLLQNARGITFEPRIEYLPTGGAMDLGAAEWVWNYTKAILKMSDSHILYRASYKLDHLLQVDALTMRPDLQEPPPDALGLLSSRCLMLERMIAQLENLEDGEYMAFQSKNIPLVVVSKCSDEDRGGVSIDAMRIKEDDIQMIPDQNSDDFFYGFAPEVPFQWQIVQGRAPRLLLAKDSPAATFVPSKNNRERVERQRHSIKRKFQEKKAEKEEAKRQKEIDWDDPNLYADFTNPSIAPMDFTRKQQKRKRGFGGGRGGGRGGKWEWRGGGGRGGRGRGGAGRGGDHHEEGGPSQEHTIPIIP